MSGSSYTSKRTSNPSHRSSYLHEGEPAIERFINNLSTRAKLILSFAVILILLGIVVVTAYVSITNITQKSKALREVHFQIALDLAILRSHENANRAGVLDMLLNSDRSVLEADEQDISERAPQIDRLLTEVLELNTDPTVDGQLQSLASELTTHRETREHRSA